MSTSKARKSFALSHGKLGRRAEEDSDGDDDEAWCIPEGVEFSLAPPALPRPVSSVASLLLCCCAQQADRDGGDDRREWLECGLALVGFQLRYYEDVNPVLANTDDWVEDAKQLGAFQIDGLTTLDRPEDDENYDEQKKSLSLSTKGDCQGPGQADQIRFRFKDENTMTDFWDTFRRRKKRFAVEMAETAKFNDGALDLSRNPQMVEYQEMLRQGLLSQEDFDMALFQQVSTDDQYLGALTGEHGANAYQDFKIKCQECGELLFNLPQDPLTECPECGSTELETPDELEEEAQAARKVEKPAMPVADE